jgi:O-antigen/teichoic acid export membrane protein
MVVPSFNIFYAKASKYLPEKKIEELKKLLNLTIRTNIFLLITSMLFILLVFKKVFILIFYPKVSIYQIEIMYYLFLAIFPHAIITAFERPYVYIAYVMKESLKVLQIAIVFLILYSLLIISSINYLKIYSLPFSLFFSQIYNTFSYFFYINGKLKVFNDEMKNDILKFALFIILLILFNIIFENRFLIKITINIFIFVLFSFIIKKEIFSIYNFLFQKIK